MTGLMWTAQGEQAIVQYGRMKRNLNMTANGKRDGGYNRNVMRSRT